MAERTETSVDELRGREPESATETPPLSEQRRRRLVLITAAITLVILITTGVIVERTAHTPLIRVGQAAPDFMLPSTDGGVWSLTAARGRPLVLAFVPSVLCDRCQEQLRALQAALPGLRAHDPAVLVVSTDSVAVQRAAANRLSLTYPILSEAPTVSWHPVGSAYGVYHRFEQASGPVDAGAIVVIDAAGVVRAVQLAAEQVVTAPQIAALVNGAIGLQGGG